MGFNYLVNGCVCYLFVYLVGIAATASGKDAGCHPRITELKGYLIPSPSRVKKVKDGVPHVVK